MIGTSARCEHDQVRLERAHRRKRLVTAARRLHVEVLKAKRHRHDLGDVGLVVDHQHA
jgi:hypothetical protein